MLRSGGKWGNSQRNSVVIGETFINLDHGPEHLWVICSEPALAVVVPGEAPCMAVFIANFTTHPHPMDQTCTIVPGEHTFVKKVTYVNYARATLLPVTLITYMLNKGTYRAHRDCSPALLRKVLQGALDSEHTPQNLQAIAQKSLTELP